MKSYDSRQVLKFNAYTCFVTVLPNGPNLVNESREVVQNRVVIVDLDVSWRIEPVHSLNREDILMISNGLFENYTGCDRETGDYKNNNEFKHCIYLNTMFELINYCWFYIRPFLCRTCI
jgi:hypothetical protein